MRYLARIEYDGSHFHGWQRQTKDISVQATVEQALSRVADESLSVVCAGRTDTGVHGVGQIVHFDSGVERPLQAWEMGTNTFLPRDVAVKYIAPASAGFHARYSALSRTYRYIIANTPSRSAIYSKRAVWVHQQLDLNAMREAADYLLGEHDFSAFRASSCQAKSPIREVQQLDITQRRDFIYIDVTANAFLHNMIRITVGALLKVGKGDVSPAWVKDVLESRDRTIGGMTSPAHGLYFIGPRYPASFAVPEVEHWPEF